MIPFCDDGTPEASFLDPEGGGRAGTHPPTVRGNPGGGTTKRGPSRHSTVSGKKVPIFGWPGPRGAGGGPTLKRILAHNLEHTWASAWALPHGAFGHRVGPTMGVGGEKNVTQ